MSAAAEARAHVDAAAARGDAVSILSTPGAIVIVIARPAHAALDALVPLDDAARIAGLRSKRTLVEAIRDGELQAFGRQRDRAVRRADLDRWIESRRIVHTAPTGDDESRIERRMNRLEREGAERRAA